MRSLSLILKAYEHDPATSMDIQKVYDLAKADDLAGINAVLKSYEGSNDLPAVAAAAKAAFANRPTVSVDSDGGDLAAALLELTNTLSALTAQA